MGMKDLLDNNNNQEVHLEYDESMVKPSGMKGIINDIDIETEVSNRIVNANIPTTEQIVKEQKKKQAEQFKQGVALVYDNLETFVSNLSNDAVKETVNLVTNVGVGLSNLNKPSQSIQNTDDTVQKNSHIDIEKTVVDKPILTTKDSSSQNKASNNVNITKELYSEALTSAKNVYAQNTQTRVDILRNPNNANSTYAAIQENTSNTKPPVTTQHFTEKTLNVPDHAHGYTDESVIKKRTEVNDFFAQTNDHFTYDINDTTSSEANAMYNDGHENDERYRKKFSGSATLINPEKDEDKDYIMKYGLHDYEQKRYANQQGNSSGAKNKLEPPLSPLRPFTSMNPAAAHEAMFKTYNRTLTPVADVEFRKGFKHILISRPECYVMAVGNVLSEQAANDLDFSSTYDRLPHLLSLLSPSYLSTGKFTANAIHSNWNYLLSNRLTGINDDFKTSIGVVDGVVKSVEGHTVTPGRTLESNQGNTISLTFRETKNFEVYEFLRLWMLYIHKIKKGIFAPSYNGYLYHNDFISPSSVTSQSLMFHPYDRALDYTASIFQLITNDSMTKIIHWTKWYGIYPVDISISGTNENGPSITNEVTVTASFRYQKKEVNNNRTLVEFNYNAGITNDLGGARSEFVLDAASNVVIDETNNSYLGAVDMFTGTPFIVVSKGPQDPITKTNTFIPYLKFSQIDDTGMDTTTINNINGAIMTPRTVGSSTNAVGTV